MTSLDPKGLQAALPCPFCGCTDISLDDNGDYEWLKCDWCGATGGVDPSPEFEEHSVHWHWNRRTSTTPSGEVEGLVERLRKAADEMRSENHNGWPVIVDHAADAFSEASTALASMKREVDQAWDAFGAVPRDKSLAAHISAALDELAGFAEDERRRAEAAEARIQELEEALKPFARCSEVYPDAKPDVPSAFGALHDPRCPLTIGDFHTASQALGRK
jgi:Lar family restriction alleviation protein